MKKIFFLYLCIIFVSMELIKHKNHRPIIGIFSIPSDYPEFLDPEHYSYIQNNYVQYLETAGAQIIPIHWNLPIENLEEMFYKINGLLFTGGDTALWKTNSSTGERTFSYFTNQAKIFLNLTEYP